MVQDMRLAVKVLAATLHEVIHHSVSVDVAFKRACRGRCRLTLEEREHLYVLARGFVKDYLKLKCLHPRTTSLSKLARLWLEGSEEADSLPLWCSLSVQEWFFKKLSSLLGEDEARELILSLNERHWWVRMNFLRGNEERILRSLDEEDVEYEKDRHFPYLLRILKSPKPVRLLKAFKEFQIIPQDKASVAVVEALRPSPGDLVLDMAFAPGVKTSLIMMLAGNEARITAVDLSYRRALLATNLLRKMGVDMRRVNIVVADSRDISFRERFDKVLLDAPCSNSGAVAKDPGLRITLTFQKILHYSETQKALVRKAIELGEEVIYSTCSLMPEEGEYVVKEVAEAVKFERPFPWTSPGYRVVEFSGDVSRLYPHKHMTEGFFLVRFRPVG